MAAPPVSVGAVQLRSMTVCLSAVAVRPVGAPGAVVAPAVVRLPSTLCPLWVPGLV